MGPADPRDSPSPRSSGRAGLSLASSGGTVPIQALPRFFQTVGHVEPLRNTLLGTRAIVYFGARGDAGLTTSIIMLACEALFWIALGLAASYWYDRKGLDRLSPDLIGYINRTVDQAVAGRGHKTKTPADVGAAQPSESPR